MKNDENKKKRDQQYLESTRKKFAAQRKALFLPHLICFIVEAALVLTLLIMDGFNVCFDETSILFTVMLICIAAVPLISLVITYFAKNTMQLLVTLTLYQLCIIPLIVAFLLKYEQLKACSSYHMMVFYFLFVVMYIVNTSVMFRIKGNRLSTSEHI